MPLLCALLFMLAAGLPGFAEDATVHRSAETIAVVMEFEPDYSPASVDEMEHEFESIMQDCSLRWDWRMLDDSISKQSFSHLVVARFRGSCRVDDLIVEDSRASSALGLTHISEGEILPFSEVDCDRVRRFIHNQVVHEGSDRGDTLLGRAMGRVLAHELYHIFAGTTRHARTGVATAVLSANELVRGRLALEPEQSLQIRRSFLPSPRQMAQRLGDPIAK